MDGDAARSREVAEDAAHFRHLHRSLRVLFEKDIFECHAVRFVLVEQLCCRIANEAESLGEREFRRSAEAVGVDKSVFPDVPFQHRATESLEAGIEGEDFHKILCQFFHHPSPALSGILSP